MGELNNDIVVGGPEGDAEAVSIFLDVLGSILSVEPLDQVLQKIANCTSQAFNMRYVLIGLRDERTGLFKVRAVSGYEEKQKEAILKHAYTEQRMREELRDEFRIAKNTFYIRRDDLSQAYDDDYAYILHPERLGKVRESEDEWGELDYIDFVMTDREGNWIGWLEINDPGDGKVPPDAVIRRIRILADLATVAVENSKLFERLLGSANETKGYLDLIIHDIGNMIVPLRGYLALQSSALSPEKRRETIEKSSRILDSMADLVANVRVYSEATSSQQPPSELVDLNKVLSSCASKVKSEHPERNLRIELSTVSGRALVIADGLIDQMFMNVLKNAVNYDPKPNVEIAVRVADVGDRWLVDIEDHGVGIPDERKEAIFTRFARRTDGRGGTSLGLSLVKLLCERYGGTISVRDRVKGDHSKGACFQIALPKAKPGGQL